MSFPLGQVLRFVGLILEAMGIMALVTHSGTDDTGNPLPGSYPRQLVWGCIALGFLIWVIGTALNFWKRPQRAKPVLADSPHDLRL